MSKPDKRIIVGELLKYVNAMHQNNAISKNEKIELVNLIRKGLSDGYDELISKLEILSSLMVFMNELPIKMLEVISGKEDKHYEG